MAPRPLESREQLIERLRRAGADVGWSKRSAELLRFGGHHHTHAVVLADGVWQVCRLVLDRARADQYMQEHGRFMPEDAEELSEPGPVVLHAPSIEGLITALQAAPWPMW